LQAEENLFSLQQDLREVKDIARGAKAKKSSKFANITKAEWQGKVDNILRLEEEAKELEAEIKQVEEAQRQKEAEEEAKRREIEQSVSIHHSGDHATAHETPSTNDLIARAIDSMETDEFYTPSAGAPAAVPVEPTAEQLFAQVQQPNNGAQVVEDEDEYVPYQSVYATRNFD